MKTTDIFVAAFEQNWENARHIKSQRIWLMNTYAVISAGVLTFLQHTDGEAKVKVGLLLFMSVFSLIGLMTSLRLKAELEECLEKLQAMSEEARVAHFVALGKSEGELARYPKFRFLFPAFYSMTMVGFVALLLYRLAMVTL